MVVWVVWFLMMMTMITVMIMMIYENQKRPSRCCRSVRSLRWIRPPAVKTDAAAACVCTRVCSFFSLVLSKGWAAPNEDKKKGDLSERRSQGPQAFRTRLFFLVCGDDHVAILGSGHKLCCRCCSLLPWVFFPLSRSWSVFRVAAAVE